MKTQRNVSVDESRSSSTNFALLRFLEQNPGIETVSDFVNHCRTRGGESYFQACCREMELDPNELCTSRASEISEWVWSDSRGTEYPPQYAAVG
ncbi:MAG TPA: hypothetical protein VF794_10370 [Archangium sp.]|jgi:hypothetical protein|uniref:hypothetical protein n=1 Tax=Archangium sp. TaxID=1872627 RepID=UPI002EDB4159